MSQFGRPDQDTFLGAYTDEVGGVVDIFNAINEVVRDDGDYIQSEVNPNQSVYVCRLSSVTDPLDDTNHFVNFTARKQPSSSFALDLTVEIREGYVSEVSQGTLIDGLVLANITAIFTDYQFEILAPEVITNYADLFLRIVSNQV